MGANLEVFKFATYLFVPLFAMLHFGDPDWYENHVKPYKDVWFPPYEETHKPPRTSDDLHTELARLKEERLARRGEATSSTGSSAAGASTSNVLANLPADQSGRFAWAAGEKRLV